MLDPDVFDAQLEDLRASLQGDIQVCNSFVRITYEPARGIRIRLEVYNLDVITCDLYVYGVVSTGRGSDVDSAFDASIRKCILGTKAVSNA